MAGSELSVIATDACGWPNLTQLADGDLLCTYFNAPSHGLMEGDLVCSRWSKKSKRWKKLSTVAKAPKGSNRMHLAVGQAHSGDLLCFSSGFVIEKGKFVRFSGQWLSRSVNGGVSWEVDPSPKVPQGIEGTIPFGRIIRLSDNRLAYASYRSQGIGKPSNTWVMQSRDDGFTWKKKSLLGEEDSNEAALCNLGGKKILAATRTHKDHHTKLCVQLKGKWMDQHDLTLPMQHPADLTPISEQIVLLTYGIRNRGLMGIGARISFNEGKTWSAPWVIHQFGKVAQDVGYPSTALLNKEMEFMSVFYTDYEPTFKKGPSRYRVLAKKWSLKDWLNSRDYQKVVAEKKRI
jgi:hypothetical protein